MEEGEGEKVERRGQKTEDRREKRWRRRGGWCF